MKQKRQKTKNCNNSAKVSISCEKDDDINIFLKIFLSGDDLVTQSQVTNFSEKLHHRYLKGTRPWRTIFKRQISSRKLKISDFLHVYEINKFEFNPSSSLLGSKYVSGEYQWFRVCQNKSVSYRLKFHLWYSVNRAPFRGNQKLFIRSG